MQPDAMLRRRLAARGEHRILFLRRGAFRRARASRSSRPDISGVNSISAPPAAASSTASASARALAAGSMPVVDWKRAMRVMSGRQQLVELAGAVERHQIVAAADVMLADEDLRNGRAASARWTISSASSHRRNRQESPEIPRPCLRAAAWPASNRGKKPWYRFRRSARRAPSRPILRHGAQRINCEGFTTRAQLISSTRAAPARFSVRAQASAVLPVVSTSSTRMTVFPVTAALSGSRMPRRPSCAAGSGSCP